MENKYTAQEMRHAADLREAWGDKDEVNEMLRQAADGLEREKKYEYVLMYNKKIISHPYKRLEYAKDAIDGYIGDTQNIIIVRREVGEWEEVPNG